MCIQFYMKAPDRAMKGNNMFDGLLNYLGWLATAIQLAFASAIEAFLATLGV